MLRQVKEPLDLPDGQPVRPAELSNDPENLVSLQFVRKIAVPLMAVLVVGVASLVGGIATRPAKTTAADSDAQDKLRQEFAEALGTIEGHYAGQPDFEALGKHSLQGLLRQLDPHSSFFTKAEFDELQTEQRSRFYGIGVTIQRIYNRVYVLSANPDGPAHRSGLRYGDAIVAVGGQNAEDWSTEQVMQRVRGEKGEPVEVTVERAGLPRHITVRILRDEVKLPSVRNVFMTGNTGTGYIALTGGFSRKTEEELSGAIARLKQEGMRQLILDLRNNQGGLLDEAVKVAEKFLPAGLKIVEVRGRDGLLKGHTSDVPDGNVPELVPMVVLINKRSASASEVVSGALQDHDRALIVGETSFGKGLVQTVFPLWGGTGLTLTTAKYYTPKGRSLQRDYSTGSFYDYYANRTDVNRGNIVHTDLGRAMYGGGGITPDVEVKSPESGALRGRLFTSVFHFARLLVVGQISGFREYRVYEAQPRQRLSPEDVERYPITDKLIAAFREYIGDKSHFSVPDASFDSALDYIHERLRSEIITAAYGPEAGQQAYLLHYDVQFLKALEKLPEARQLAENVSRLRGERQ